MGAVSNLKLRLNDSFKNLFRARTIVFGAPRSYFVLGYHQGELCDKAQNEVQVHTQILFELKVNDKSSTQRFLYVASP